jgi:hypothetical protein
MGTWTLEMKTARTTNPVYQCQSQDDEVILDILACITPML